MNTQDQKNGLACDAAQELLLKKNFESLAQTEALALAVHLQHCRPCAAFQMNLAHIAKFIRVSASESLAPDPAIRERLRNQFTPSRQAVKASNKIWRTVTEALNFKIPAYQAVLGMVVVAVMFLAFGKLSAPGDGKVTIHAQMAETKNQRLAPPAALNHVAEIDSQKIGRTVADDSLLMKFMVAVSGENI